MLHRTLLLAAVVTFMVGCSTSMEDLGGKSSTSLSSRDNDFFKTISVANDAEIQTSQLALTQSARQDVRNFAQRMIDDHRAAQQKVAALAAEKGVSLPTKLDKDDQDEIEGLHNKSGNDFDQDYIKFQVQAHKDTIKADQDEANNGNDPDVKALAGDLLGTLQHHLDMAKTLENQSL